MRFIKSIEILDVVELLLTVHSVQLRVISMVIFFEFFRLLFLALLLLYVT